MNERFEIEQRVTTDSANVVELLAAATVLSKTQIKEVMKKGAVWLERGGSERRIRRAKFASRRGDVVRMCYDPRVIRMEPPVPSLVADASTYSVWYKPAGLMSSGSRFGDHCAINRWVETNFLPERPVFLVHRLDRATSGIMVLAHTRSAAARVSESFQGRDVDKQYWARVEGLVAADFVCDEALDGKPASSRIRVLDRDVAQGQSDLLVAPTTGPKHQIRRHLASAGHPVVGDDLYGACRTEGPLQLVAFSLAFPCPSTGRRMCFVMGEGSIDMPPSLRRHLAAQA